MALKILRTGAYVPDKTISNFDLEKIMDTSDEWISQRTGIRERRFCQGEDTSDLAVKAAKIAVENINKENIKMIIVASFTPDYIMPNIASVVHASLELGEDCFCADINLACTGFTAALKLAEGYLKDGEEALVIGSEAISKHLDMDDRSTAVLFGDGAGACLVKKTSGDLFYNHGVIKDDEYLTMYGKSLAEKSGYIEMKGKDVYKFAVTYVPKTIKKTLEKANLEAENIDFYILHQANGRIIQQVAKRLGISEEKFPMNLDKYANTSAASIPIVLAELDKNNTVKEGDVLLMSSFGAGLQYSSMIIEW